MNAKLMPLTPKIKDWLAAAKKTLIEKDIKTAGLDSELILAHILNKTRTYLYAHDDQILSKSQVKLANKFIRLRTGNYPIAYILGKKEFYGREFIVNKNTLIPRPESEDIIEILKTLIPHLSIPNSQLLDIGTGSGCLGITAKLEISKLNVELIDISKKALKIANKNATNLDAKIKITNSNLLSKVKSSPEIIIANLPYVDKTWQRSPETDFEPNLALFANNHGLEIIQKLIIQASNIQKTKSYLIIEADPCQHAELIEYAKKYSYKVQDIKNYILLFSKI